MPPEENDLDPELQRAVESSLRYPLVIDLDRQRAEADDTDPEAPETEPEPEPEPEAEPDDQELPEPPEPGEETPGTPADTEPPAAVIELAPGVNLPRDLALSYYEFDALLRQDPELQHLIDEHVRGRSGGGEGSPGRQQPSSPPTIPDIENLDLEDPAIAALYNTAKQQQEYLQSVEQRLAQLSDVAFTREAEEVATLITNTKVTFATQHNLSTDEMEKVASVAERMNLVPSLLNGIDPVTGQPCPRDRGTALNRAFDIAYWYLPEFREREVTEAVTKRAKSAQRKQRLAGVSGSQGSVNKTPPQIRTEQDRREAMIRDVAEYLGQPREE